MLIAFDVFIKVPDVEQERCAFAAMEVGQTSALDQFAELPFADAEVFCRLASAEEAVLGWGRKTHIAPLGSRRLLTIVSFVFPNRQTP